MKEGFEHLSKKCFFFLKQCLRNLPSNFPVRGPSSFKKGEFRYINDWKGELENFVGEEKIFYKNQQIYFRNYLGGTGSTYRKTMEKES